MAAAFKINGWAKFCLWFKNLYVVLNSPTKTPHYESCLKSLLDICCDVRDILKDDDSIQCKSNISRLDYTSTDNALFRISSFFRFLQGIAMKEKEKNIQDDDEYSKNMYFNAEFFNVVMEKYVPYVSLWSTLMLEDNNRKSNAPIERFFGIVKNSMLKKHMRQKCSRVIRKIRKYVLFIYKEEKLEMKNKNLGSKRRIKRKEKCADEGNTRNLDELLDIERETRNQSECPLWFEERHKRITASFFGKVVKASQNSTLEKLALKIITQPKVTSEPISHGKINESSARIAYENINNIHCETAGLVIHEDFQYIAGSPDGLVGENGIIEIKCPFKIRNMDPDIAIKQGLLPYVDKASGKLKTSHEYYYQVQGLLEITNSDWCDFIIYTFRVIKTERIARDKNTWEVILNKVQRFFNFYMLPHLACITKTPLLYKWRSENSINILYNGLVADHTFYRNIGKNYIIAHFEELSCTVNEVTSDDFQILSTNQWLTNFLIDIYLNLLNSANQEYQVVPCILASRLFLFSAVFPRRLKLGSLPVWNLGETEYTIEDCIMVPRCKGIHKTHSMLETPSSSTALEMMRCTSPVTECSTIEDSLCATQGSTAPVTKENSPTAGCSRNEALPRTPKTSKAFRRKATGYRIIRKIVRSVCELAPDFIKWPSNRHDAALIWNGFREEGPIPKVIGAIDGCHIDIP
ncbi:hypothetical protein JTB14_001370 [Gonioctena quinquepunctata]|nr:hypothetical protein JTB14_001370 [Gonioctena quinquepunctata]